MRFMCDLEMSTKIYEKFKEWYFKEHPDFKGTIRRSVKEFGIAEIIDENQNLREYRFCRI